MSDESDYDSDYEAGATSVFLGFADDVAEVDLVTAFDNHLGGQPVWLHPESAPEKSMTTCDQCDTPLNLLAQISAPLVEGEYYDRALYVFACAGAKCRRSKGSVKALRAIRKDEAEIAKIKQQEKDERQKKEDAERIKEQKIKSLGESMFSGASGGGANPFGSANSSNPFGSDTVDGDGDDDAAPKSSSNKKKVQQDEPAKGSAASQTGAGMQGKKHPQFDQCYYITVDTEVLDHESEEPVDMSKIEYMKENEEVEGPSSTSSSSSASLTKEQNDLINMVQAAASDKTFQHFNTIVNNNPEQVVRYEPQTLEPLLFRDDDDTAKELDTLGDSTKKLELQIMPHAIQKLQPENIIDSMEWGTIFVATSASDKDMPSLDHNGVGYIQEWCGVQWEDVIDMSKKPLSS